MFGESRGLCTADETHGESYVSVDLCPTQMIDPRREVEADLGWLREHHSGLLEDEVAIRALERAVARSASAAVDVAVLCEEPSEPASILNRLLDAEVLPDGFKPLGSLTAALEYADREGVAVAQPGQRIQALPLSALISDVAEEPPSGRVTVRRDLPVLAELGGRLSLVQLDRQEGCVETRGVELMLADFDLLICAVRALSPLGEPARQIVRSVVGRAGAVLFVLDGLDGIDSERRAELIDSVAEDLGSAVGMRPADLLSSGVAIVEIGSAHAVLLQCTREQRSEFIAGVQVRLAAAVSLRMGERAELEAAALSLSAPQREQAERRVAALGPRLMEEQARNRDVLERRVELALTHFREQMSESVGDVEQTVQGIAKRAVADQRERAGTQWLQELQQSLVRSAEREFDAASAESAEALAGELHSAADAYRQNTATTLAQVNDAVRQLLGARVVFTPAPSDAAGAWKLPLVHGALASVSAWPRSSWLPRSLANEMIEHTLTMPLRETIQDLELRLRMDREQHAEEIVDAYARELTSAVESAQRDLAQTLERAAVRHEAGPERVAERLEVLREVVRRRDRLAVTRAGQNETDAE